MRGDPVVVLPEAEYRRVWDRFYGDFSFQSSTSPFKWPAIEEPVASVTWSLAVLDEDPDDDRLDRLIAVVEQGQSFCVGPSGTLLALDWQPTSHRVAPQEAGGPRQPAWPLSPYPDGDYFIFLAEDSASAVLATLGKGLFACSVKSSSTSRSRKSTRFSVRRSAGQASR
ncbi:DUF2716 domain-containing protein [Streptomyces sp. NPDC059849]|uniref:DUF2716 domain-containing protein n=1 Tax=Streptomyces sp. NPDC059849 TaxID=3346969 RepID=UPI003658AD81